MSDVEVRHAAAQSRFSALVDGVECELDYRRTGNTMVITHTGVPEAVGGRGIAGTLTRAALEWARAEGLKVSPQCSYAAVFFRRHPEYADLLV